MLLYTMKGILQMSFTLVSQQLPSIRWTGSELTTVLVTRGAVVVVVYKSQSKSAGGLEASKGRETNFLLKSSVGTHTCRPILEPTSRTENAFVLL